MNSRKTIKKKKRVEKLSTLQNKWVDCKLCDLHKERNNVVLWRGNPVAPIMFIGEAPGETEDLEGVPFIGASGKQLDLMIKECGLEPDRHTFISNVLGCRPPKNAKPDPKQVRQCRPRIERLIHIVKPKIIILLGGQAALHMAGITILKPWKGKIVKVSTYGGDFTYNAMVTYHPSYYLRRGKSKVVWNEMISHIKTAIKRIA